MKNIIIQQFVCWIFVQVAFFQKYYFGNTIMCQHFRSRYGLTHSVSPDLGQNCLQKLSADHKSDREKVDHLLEKRHAKS